MQKFLGFFLVRMLATVELYVTDVYRDGFSKGKVSRLCL